MTNLFDNIKDVLKRDFSLKGTITRRDFFSFFIPYLLFIYVVPIVLLLNDDISTDLAAKVYVIYSLVAIVGLIPLAITSIKRLRDAGLSPWLILVAAIPYVGPIILFFLLCKPTKK